MMGMECVNEYHRVVFCLDEVIMKNTWLVSPVGHHQSAQWGLDSMNTHFWWLDEPSHFSSIGLSPLAARHLQKILRLFKRQLKISLFTVLRWSAAAAGWAGHSSRARPLSRWGRTQAWGPGDWPPHTAHPHPAGLDKRLCQILWNKLMHVLEEMLN